MPQNTELSAEYLLLTTLIVQVAVAAVLSTMLVRFPWFRRILLTEKRDWPERLVFAVQPRHPARGRRRRPASAQFQPADLTLPGAFLAGLIAGPTPGRWSASMVGMTALAGGEWIALPFAIGCGFAGGGLREICPKEAIWHFSPLFFTDLHRYVWRLVRRFEIDWIVILLAAPIGLEIILQALGHRFGERAHLLPRATTRGCSSSWSSRRSCAWPFRSRSGTARASSTGSRNRKSC